MAHRPTPMTAPTIAFTTGVQMVSAFHGARPATTPTSAPTTAHARYASTADVQPSLSRPYPIPPPTTAPFTRPRITRTMNGASAVPEYTCYARRLFPPCDLGCVVSQVGENASYGSAAEARSCGSMAASADSRAAI